MTNQQHAETLKNWMLTYGRLVYTVAYKILANEQDAEDIFQNTFAKAYFRCGKLKSHGNIKAWLCRTATNDALNWLASSWKKKVKLCDIPVELADSQPKTSEIAGLVESLPAIYRKCIWLYYYAGYKTHEIAEMTGVAHSTVLTRLRRARGYLKADIQKLDKE